MQRQRQAHQRHKSVRLPYPDALFLSQLVYMDFWASRGEVSLTEAVGFVLAGQADPAAIIDSLTDYVQLLHLLGQYNTPEQQLQLLRVSQGVLKQAAQVMWDSAVFQVQSMRLMQQLLQVQCTKPVLCRQAALQHNQGRLYIFGNITFPSDSALDDAISMQLPTHLQQAWQHS